MAEIVELQERKRGTRCCDPVQPRLTGDEATEFNKDLEILAHPIRIQILDILSRNDGQICVCDLESALPVKQPTISHHLKLLRERGIIGCERYGLWAYYFVNREALASLRARIGALLELFS
jgi:ArsR family transcriptional regulator